LLLRAWPFSFLRTGMPTLPETILELPDLAGNLLHDVHAAILSRSAPIKRARPRSSTKF
jgi:hypothetical protein